jgi:hypothetical protein
MAAPERHFGIILSDLDATADHQRRTGSPQLRLVAPPPPSPAVPQFRWERSPVDGRLIRIWTLVRPN